MSQVSIIDITGNHPQIPTEFIADIGFAIPIANQLEIFGDVQAAGAAPVHTFGSGNNITTFVQISQAIAASNALNIGLCAFNSAQFSVDVNGFVSLKGGGLAIDSFTTDISGPVLPDANGNVAFTASTFIFSDGSVGNTMRLGVQGTNHALFVGRGSLLNVAQLAVGTNGQVLIGATGADPAFATITSTGGTIAFTLGANTLNMDVVAAGIVWSDKSTDFNADVNNGYFITGSCIATLPATPANGSRISFIVDGSFVVTITANTGQTIKISSNTSSSAGTQFNTADGDTVTLIYRSTNTRWIAESFVGGWNFT